MKPARSTAGWRRVLRNNDALDEWTVKLRPGTEWSDGKPLTSEDVVFTINMLTQYAPQLNWSGAVKQWVKSVEAVDDRTIKFTLTGPNPRFVMENLAGTTSQAIVPLPKHIWEGQDPVTFKNPANSGNRCADLQRPVYCKEFLVDGVRLQAQRQLVGRQDGCLQPAGAARDPQADGSAMMRPLIRCWPITRSDIGGPATPSILQSLQAQNPKLVSYTDKAPLGWIDPCPRMLTVNTTVQPWDKKEMRWALSYAMNRQQIVDVVNEGAGATSSFIFPDYKAMQPYQDAIKDVTAPIGEFNLDKSRQLIEARATSWTPPQANSSARMARRSRSTSSRRPFWSHGRAWPCSS